MHNCILRIATSITIVEYVGKEKTWIFLNEGRIDEEANEKRVNCEILLPWWRYFIKDWADLMC